MAKRIIIKSKKADLSKLVQKAVLKGIYTPMIRSRHPSHNGIRKVLKKLPFRSVIRFGSTTEMNDIHTLNGSRIELNSIEAIKNSSSKLKMKECFQSENVKTAQWIKTSSLNNVLDFAKENEYPIVAKSYFGSRGKGNTLLKNQKEVEEFFNTKGSNNSYIFEKYYNYNKEYRLHVTKNGCFYSCRKMLKQDFKDHPNAWQRHDDNCVWILESNELFDKPNNWNEIVEHCVKALKSCGLDFGACDLRVQNNIDKDGNVRTNPDFIVVEINSAPSFGEVTLEKYKEILPQLLIEKYDNKKNR